MKKNERAEFYLLLFRKCTTVVEASFPINLEYPSHSALLFSWEILHNILWSQNSENSLHFVSLSKRLHVVGMWNLQRNVIKQGKLPSKVVVRAQKTPLLPIVGGGMWRPFGEMTRTFAALLSARKGREKTDIFPGFSVVSLLRVWQNKCASFSVSLKWQTNLTTNLLDGGCVLNNLSKLKIQEKLPLLLL